MPLHRFCVHTLTVIHRTIEMEGLQATANQVVVPNEMSRENPLLAALNRELRKLNEEAAAERTAAAATSAAAAAAATTTPEIITGNTLPNTSGLGNLMSLSQSWLLAASLPNCFTRFQERKVPTQAQAASGGGAGSVGGGNINESKLDMTESGNVAIPSPIDANTSPPMSHLMSTIPTHWSLLYDSQQHGVGANRFLHHVIGYKGPTLVLLQSETKEVFCLASPTEWRETHLYTGNDDCHIIQLLPKYVHSI